MYFLNYAHFYGQGYLNSFTNPKSSAVANTYFYLDSQSQEFISEPSEQGGHIPYYAQPSFAVFVNHSSSL